jgi:hypothetical protein
MIDEDLNNLVLDLADEYEQDPEHFILMLDAGAPCCCILLLSSFFFLLPPRQV